MCCDARAGPDDAPAQAVRDAVRLRQPEPHIQRRGDVHRRGRWVRGGTERPSQSRAEDPGPLQQRPRSKKVAKLFSETIACVPKGDTKVASIFFTAASFPRNWFHPACFGGFWRFRADSRRIIFGGFSW